MPWYHETVIFSKTIIILWKSHTVTTLHPSHEYTSCTIVLLTYIQGSKYIFDALKARLLELMYPSFTFHAPDKIYNSFSSVLAVPQKDNDKAGDENILIYGS